MNLGFFSNDRYFLLKLLFDKQIQIKEDLYIPFSQQEIADIAHFSKLKTNRILNELKDSDFIILYKNTRGKYAITERANKLISIFENTQI